MKLAWTLAGMIGISGSACGQTAAPQNAPPASVGQPSSPPPGVYRVGGDVKPPVPISMPDPDFSEKARRKKISGTVRMALIVDREGKPQQVHVVGSIANQVGKKDAKAALSLDAKAVEAVKQYQFKPATKDGLAVAVEMNVEISIDLF